METHNKTIKISSAEENAEDSDDEDTEYEDSDDEESDAKAKKYVHVGLQQLNRRKIITIVEGIKKKFDYNLILKDLMEECCCNGRIVMDPEFGEVIQLVGDQRRNVRLFLVQEGIVKKKYLKMHEETSVLRYHLNACRYEVHGPGLEY
ncbi:hypothetical protein CR513_39953, partial [Mucuna pruriens]